MEQEAGKAAWELHNLQSNTILTFAKQGWGGRRVYIEIFKKWGGRMWTGFCGSRQ